MSSFRIIPKLEIKGTNVVKGMRMEGLRVVGEPEDMCKKYLTDGADEILFIDTVASLYNRNQLHDLVASTSRISNVPTIVGGGIRSLRNIYEVLKNGADKVSINTAAHRDSNFISQACREFGSQCIVVSVQAKKRGENFWEALYLNGREKSDKDVIDWCSELSSLGVGEVLLTSVDFDGTRQGLDTELISRVLPKISQPLLVSGGTASINDIIWAAQSGASGIVLGNILHFSRIEISTAKSELLASDILVSIRDGQ